MTEKMFEMTKDCMKKISGVVPSEDKREEMFSLLGQLDRSAEIDSWEGPNGLRIEIDNWPDKSLPERILKETVKKWLSGMTVEEVSDFAADKYMEADPQGYDAAICFAAAWGARSLIIDEHPYSFIDQILQNLLPDGYRWTEEDAKEEESHKDDESWFGFLNGGRKTFIGEVGDEIFYRFDDIKIGSLVDMDDVTESLGRSVSEKLLGFHDGALQEILRKLTYIELENTLFALTREAEDRIFSNIDKYHHSKLKGDCILKKDNMSILDIRVSLNLLQKALDSYDGDPLMEAGYDDM